MSSKRRRRQRPGADGLKPAPVKGGRSGTTMQISRPVSLPRSCLTSNNNSKSGGGDGHLCTCKKPGQTHTTQPNNTTQHSTVAAAAAAAVLSRSAGDTRRPSDDPCLPAGPLVTPHTSRRWRRSQFDLCPPPLALPPLSTSIPPPPSERQSRVEQLDFRSTLLTPAEVKRT